MNRVRLLAALAAALCAGTIACDKKHHAGTNPPIVTQCDAGVASFVRNADLALLGRRPLGEKEVDGFLQSPGGVPVHDSPALRTQIVDQIMSDPEFVDRWAEVFTDLLRVPRIDDQQMYGCYGSRQRPVDDGGLARYVRGHAATATGDGGGAFSMLDLLDSAIQADDLSVAYRGHLFAMINFPIPAANVPRIAAERARRQDFGQAFDAAYLNRDMVCLQCHNSEFSVTFDADPAINRHWPMPGLFEKSIYGASTGVDAESAHAVFRTDGFLAGFFQGDVGEKPWNWTAACGQFHSTVGEDDPAGIDAKFGAITGQRATVYDLEASLKSGLEAIEANGLQKSADGTIADPDEAFAYLVGATITEGVWREVVGSSLTIANYFPRNQVSRDELVSLTDHFVRSKFSLRTLLHDIVQSAYFNQLPPDAACTATAYAYPNIFDPWVVGDDDAAKRLNSSADGVAALPARVLMRAAASALEWPLPDDRGFPQTQTQEDYMRGVGMFLKNSERGFRGLDFQARLVWEDRVATCVNPGGTPDFIDGVLQRAAAAPATTVQDVVLTLKDRLLSEAVVDTSGTSEKDALEAIFGAPLDSAASSAPDLAGSTRKLCGIYLSTPQFLLSGFANPRLDPVPALAP